jgi:predicted RNA binding protein YcfA (HicA-like mRNA interferase family)
MAPEPVWDRGAGFSGRGYNWGRPDMPRKIRELIRDLKKAGFVNRGSKGSHRNSVHPKVARSVVLSGREGDDAKAYQERDVKLAIEESRS